MIRKLPFIQIFTGLYVLAVALYMIYNCSDTKEQAEFWKNYYWIVNKAAMLMALAFNYKKNKTSSEWLTVNFLTMQTIIILLYFMIGLPYFYYWMQINDAIIYSFFVGSFLALLWLWYKRIKEVEP